MKLITYDKFRAFRLMKGRNVLRKNLVNLFLIICISLGLAPSVVNAADTHHLEMASSENLTREEIDPSQAPKASFWFAPSKKEARDGLGYYRDTVTPGETREYKFYVKNLLNEKLNLKIYATDPVPLQNGGKDFGAYNAGVTNAGTWLYPQGSKDITLGPQEMREYTYRASIPKDIAPGQHVGVVAVSEYNEFRGEAVATNIENTTLAPDIENQNGLWVVMDYKIDEAKHAMSINTFTHDYIASGESRFTVTLENRGTILEKPTGYIEVRDSSKKVIFREEYEAGSIYYGTTANMVSIAQNQLLMPGEYEAYFEANFAGQKEWKLFKFTVTAEAKDEAQAAMEHYDKLEVTDGIPDWLKYVLVIGGILILLLLILLFWLLVKRKKGDIEERIKMYLAKGLTFEKTRKKVQLDQKTFTLYVVKLGYITDGEEPEWDKTIHTCKHARLIAIAMVENTSTNNDSNTEVLEGTASPENLKGGEGDVEKGA